MILYIDSCVRHDSRTQYLVSVLLKELNGDVHHLHLEDIDFGVSNEAFLDQREKLINEGAFDHNMFAMARQFADADIIVISAPYWDLSFPATLKQYFEKITVNGITFKYTPEGIPTGLCKAQWLYYVTTAGGYYAPDDYGYGYIQALSQGYYGINDFRLIKAVGLDIEGADIDEILHSVEEKIKAMALE